MAPGLTAGSSASGSSSQRAKARLPSLPFETLDTIFQYVGYSGLFNLCLVCQPFHDLAASHLYRRVRHAASSGLDTKVARHSLDHFTAMLETVATSDYHYAGFIRHISLEQANMTDVPRAESRGSPNDHGYTNAKLLHSLLLIVLKRVTGLESFRWDLPVELSPSIFKALRQMSSFKNLHIRLPSGTPAPTASSNSVAIAPQPPAGAPPPFDITGVVETTNQMAHYHGHSHQNNHQTIYPQTVLGFHPNSSIKSPLMQQLGLFKIDQKPRDLSLFSGLKSLAILDIDDLNFVPEVAKCITSCSSSIKSVKFSLSEHFAMKARKPNNGGYSDSESISEVDEFGWNQNHVAPPGPSGWGITVDPVPSAPPTNSPEARRARAAQEAILSEIFGLEEPTFQIHLDHALEQAIVAGDQKARKVAKLPSKTEEDRNFVQVLRQMVEILPAAVYSGSGSSRSLKALQLIEKATTRYLERMDEGAGDKEKTAAASSSSKSKNKKTSPKDSKLDIHAPLSQDNATASDQDASATPNILPEASQEPITLTEKQEKTDEYISSVVDMERPDVEEEGEDQEFVDPDDGAGSHTPGKKPDPAEANSEDAPAECSPSFSAGRAKGKQALREIQDATKSLHADPETTFDQSLDEYVRSTHGLSLDSLSIHLIPVKATVLCRAVDVFTLKHLSLLNVGHQRVLWTMLAKLHQIRPLQLTSIHTDNVTPSFLSFVNCLDRVTELFMIEDSSRAKMESFAPRTTVKIEDIKQLILNKHMKHLRRLMIRNDDTAVWALNSQTARFIAAHGSNLVELAVGLNSSSYHHFMQWISGLRSLVALQIFYFHPDSCLTMLRELRGCVVDHILHFAHLRIEYVAMCYSSHGPVHNYAMHIMSPSRIGFDPRTFKQSAMSSLEMDTMGKMNPVSSSTGSSSTSSPGLQSPEESESEAGQQGSRLNMIIKGIRIRDITGIKMWEKEIWNLSL